MKKLIALILAMLMVLSMTACNAGAENGTTTEETEPFVTNTLIQNGASSYIIVL